MKKILLGCLAFALCTFFQCSEGETYFYLVNKTDRTLLYEWSRGGNDSYRRDIYKIEQSESRILLGAELEYEEDAAIAFSLFFYSREGGENAYFRIYNQDTVLLKEWRGDFDLTSHERELFRESDWRRDKEGDSYPFVSYSFSIYNNDLKQE